MELPGPAGRARAREERLGYGSFCRNLIAQMSSSAEDMGSREQRRVAARLNDAVVRADGDTSYAAGGGAALDARFELGLSNESYLCQTVMPLHSAVDSQCNLYPHGLYPQVESAGKLGAVSAMLDEVERQADDVNDEFKGVVKLVEWLLELREVKDHVELRLANPECQTMYTGEALRLLALKSQTISTNNQFVHAMIRDKSSKTMTAICEIVDCILISLTTPLDAVIDQIDFTVDGTDKRLYESLERLARGVCVADSVRHATDPQSLRIVRDSHLSSVHSAQFGNSAASDMQIDVAPIGVAAAPNVLFSVATLLGSALFQWSGGDPTAPVLARDTPAGPFTTSDMKRRRFLDPSLEAPLLNRTVLANLTKLWYQGGQSKARISTYMQSGELVDQLVQGNNMSVVEANQTVTQFQSEVGAELGDYYSFYSVAGQFEQTNDDRLEFAAIMGELQESLYKLPADERKNAQADFFSALIQEQRITKPRLEAAAQYFQQWHGRFRQHTLSSDDITPEQYEQAMRGGLESVREDRRDSLDTKAKAVAAAKARIDQSAARPQIGLVGAAPPATPVENTLGGGVGNQTSSDALDVYRRVKDAWSKVRRIEQLRQARYNAETEQDVLNKTQDQGKDGPDMSERAERDTSIVQQRAAMDAEHFAESNAAANAVREAETSAETLVDSPRAFQDALRTQRSQQEVEAVTSGKWQRTAHIPDIKDDPGWNLSFMAWLAGGASILGTVLTAVPVIVPALESPAPLDGPKSPDDNYGTAGGPNPCEQRLIPLAPGQDTNDAELALKVAAWTLTETSTRLDAALPTESKRVSGISPYWRVHPRSTPDNAAAVYDSWGGDFWADPTDHVANADAVNLANLIDNGAGSAAVGRIVARGARRPEDAATRFVLARGLCGVNGPHQPHPFNVLSGTSIAAFLASELYYDPRGGAVARPQLDKLVYAFPHNGYEGPTSLTAASADERLARKDQLQIRGSKAYSMLPTKVKDYVMIPMQRSSAARSALTPSEPTVDDAHEVKWMPVTDGVEIPSVKHNAVTRAISAVVVHEALIDYYAEMVLGYTQDPPSMKPAALAARCAAKIRQLAPLARVLNAVYDDSDALPLSEPAPARNAKDANGRYTIQREMVAFTRPCMRCPAQGSERDGDVLYPYDAGVARFAIPKTQLSYLNDPKVLNAQWTPTLGNLTTNANRSTADQNGRSFTVVDYQGRNVNKSMEEVTYGVKQALGAVMADGRTRTACLFAAPPPETTVVKNRSVGVRTPAGALRQVSQKTPNNADHLEMSSIRKALMRVKYLCLQLKELKSDKEYLKEEEEKLRAGTLQSDPDDVTRLRRSAIYNDALREAAISGDRLWTFVQQLSGTIAEPVDEICVLDETELMKQNRDRSERQRQASNRAADAHLQIVRSIFSAAMRDSGLKFGISSDGNDIRIRNAAVQKQAAELVQRPPVDTGFFANAVNIEQLLSEQGGDLTLDTLFERLRSVARSLQRAAEEFMPIDAAAGMTSLEFLRAPRNSLFIQWKDQIKAGIRRAYDYFINEMRQHGHLMRTISAYELVEGADPELCNAFAEFTAQYIAMTRMHNPSSAMYVSQSAATVGSHKTRIALQRLVATACRYIGRYQSPASAGSREAYFRGGGGTGFAMVPVPIFTNHGGWRQIVPRMGP